MDGSVIERLSHIKLGLMGFYSCHCGGFRAASLSPTCNAKLAASGFKYKPGYSPLVPNISCP